MMENQGSASGGGDMSVCARGSIRARQPCSMLQCGEQPREQPYHVSQNGTVVLFTTCPVRFHRMLY